MSANYDEMDRRIEAATSRMKPQNPAFCPDADTMACYFDNLLTEKERDEVELHLALCHDCCDQVIEMNRIIRADVEPASVPEVITKKSMDLVQKSPLEALLPSPGKTKPHPLNADRVIAGISSRRILGFGAAAALASILLVFLIPSWMGFSLFGPQHFPTPLQLSMQITGRQTIGEDSGGLTGVRTGFMEKGTPSPKVHETPLEEGGILRSGDGFQIHFNADQDAHVYVLLHSSSGAVNLLFPKPTIELSNEVMGGRSYILPPKDQWFFLDDNTGTETVFLLASRESIEDLSRFLQSLWNADINEIRVAIKEKAEAVESVSFHHVDNEP